MSLSRKTQRLLTDVVEKFRSPVIVDGEVHASQNSVDIRFPRDMDKLWRVCMEDATRISVALISECGKVSK